MSEVEGMEFASAGLHSDDFVYHGHGYAPLEAFYTSGGISTMAKSYEGKIADMSYKTIRYRGHCNKMNLLLDLFVRGRSSEVRAQFERAMMSFFSEWSCPMLICLCRPSRSWITRRMGCPPWLA